MSGPKKGGDQNLTFKNPRREAGHHQEDGRAVTKVNETGLECQ